MFSKLNDSKGLFEVGNMEDGTEGKEIGNIFVLFGEFIFVDMDTESVRIPLLLSFSLIVFI